MNLSKNDFLSKLFHPITLALLVSLVSVWFIFPQFEVYVLEEVSNTYLNTDQKKSTFFADLNHDGQAQIVNLMNPSAYAPTCIYYNSREGGYGIDQFNYRGHWLKYGQVIIGDYNNNIQDEIYAFNRVEDSVFLNITEVMLKNGLDRRDIFIDLVPAFKENEYDVALAGGELHDIDNDGNKELLFALLAGYSKSPRAFYVYDIDVDSIYRSPKSGSGLIGGLKFKDVNNDGFPEVLGVITAPYNYHLPIPYPDSSSWLMVYTKNSEFLFPPVELPHPYSNFISDFIELENETYILSLCQYQLLNEKIYTNEIRLYDLQGNLLKTRIPATKNPQEKISAICFDKRKSETRLISNKGGVFELDKKLNLNKIHQLSIEDDEIISLFYNQSIDLDGNGFNEYILKSSKGDLMILSDDLKHLNRLKINALPIRPKISVALMPNEKAVLGISTKDAFIEYRYYKNPYTWLKFPTITFVFLLSYLLFYLLVKVQKQKLEKRYKAEKQISKYQYQGLRNQLDPHFTLNILNAIQSLFYQKDFDKAKGLLSKYGKLNRNALQNAEKIAISLEDELDFVENFLALEKFRYEERFDYFIKVDKAIDTEQVQLPRMLIHTFAENAIKHGLFPKGKGGFLKIEVKENEKNIQINIEDNGVGRAKSKELKTTNNGKGLGIIKELVKLYNKLQKTKITYNTIDLFEEEKAVGTRVEVLLPTKAQKN
ncbi:MAG: histidine kinase [Bacteroidales bacterium]|nr:histidine kinase [Bacteroidales bacterium]